jgi:hypothetical protein
MDLDEYIKQCLESPKSQSRGWAKFIHTPTPGLFVPKECSDTANWIGNFEINHEFLLASDEKIPGHLFKTPRLCVVAESQLLCQGPYIAGSKSSKSIIGTWQKEKHQTTRAITGNVPVSYFLIFFLDEENRLLHKDPIQLKIQGLYGKEFTDHYKKFCMEMFANKEVIGEKKKDMTTATWENYRKLMLYGSKNGTRNDSVRIYSCTFVFCPAFESSFATRQAGGKNAMRTCNTKGYLPASGSLIVHGKDEEASDYRSVQEQHFQLLTAFDHHYEKNSEKNVADEPSTASTIIRRTVATMDETFDDVE